MIVLTRFKDWFHDMRREFVYRLHPLAYRATMEKELQDFAPDIVQCHDWQTLELGCRHKAQSPCTLIFDSHELETHRNPPLSPARRRFMEAYEARLLPSCDFVTSVSPGIALFLESKHGIERPQIIYNAPDLSTTIERKERQSRWGRPTPPGGVRSETAGTEGQFLMVVIGNIHANRGIETVLEAMAHLQRQHVHLACIGRIAHHYRLQLERIVEEHELTGRVHFLSPVHPEDVVAYVSSADLALVPLIPFSLSYELALPNKLFEAAFAGLPIVASDTFEVDAIIKRYGLGVTFAAGDALECAAAIAIFHDRWISGEAIAIENDAFRRDHEFGARCSAFAVRVSALS